MQRTSFRRDEAGSVLVEAALVLPLILLLCFGTIQYSLALVANANMYDAARQAARQLAVGAWTPAEARTNIPGMLVDWPQNWTINAVTAGDEARVTIAVSGREAGILSVVPMPATFTAEVAMRMETSS
ncbi:MAG: TadE/TadG family type IV pilus assembly protein [Pseudomonadota bacterium]